MWTGRANDEMLSVEHQFEEKKMEESLVGPRPKVWQYNLRYRFTSHGTGSAGIQSKWPWSLDYQYN